MTKTTTTTKHYIVPARVIRPVLTAADRSEMAATAIRTLASAGWTLEGALERLALTDAQIAQIVEVAAINQERS